MQSLAAITNSAAISGFRRSIVGLALGARVCGGKVQLLVVEVTARVAILVFMETVRTFLAV